MRANQLRLWFSSIAYTPLKRCGKTLLPTLNRRLPGATPFGWKLFKIGGNIRISVRGIVYMYATRESQPTPILRHG